MSQFNTVGMNSKIGSRPESAIRTKDNQSIKYEPKQVLVYKGKIDLKQQRDFKQTISIINKSKENILHKKTNSVAP